VNVSDLKTTQLVRKTLPIKLRVSARARYTPDIHDKFDLRGAKKIYELGDGPRRMPDREKAKRHAGSERCANFRDRVQKLLADDMSDGASVM
jgi:hypothetical protein